MDKTTIAYDSLSHPFAVLSEIAMLLEIQPGELFGERSRTAEEISAEFRAEVRELGESPLELAERLHNLGDYRPFDTTLRGVQRMLSGETRVSGEMKALVAMMLRQQRRLQDKYAGLAWSRLPDGSYSAADEGFRMTLSPQSRGRWKVHIFHKDGYSHPWP